MAEAGREFGGLDIVVANVSALAIDNTEDAWRKEFEIDVLHTVRTVNAAMPYLEKSKAAAIVVISAPVSEKYTVTAPASTAIHPRGTKPP